MDPVSAALIGGAVGGAGGKLVEKGWELGEKWLAEYYEGHRIEALEKARQNVRGFLKKVAESIKQMQQTGDEEAAKRIDLSLADPDFAGLLHHAIMTSARTPDAEKQAILARIVTERLYANPDQMLSLVSSAAIRAAGAIRPNHYHFLALHISVSGIRPDGQLLAQVAPEKLDYEARSWWERMVGPLLEKVSDLSEIELMHLVAVGCLQYHGFLGRNLGDIVKSGFGAWDPTDFLKNSEFGRRLQNIYERQLQHCDLTSIGRLLGVYATDELMGTSTRILW